MITHLFDYKSTDYIDGGIQYYDCVLKVDIGELKCGQEVSAIAVVLDSGEIEFYDENGECPIHPVPFKVVLQ